MSCRDGKQVTTFGYAFDRSHVHEYIVRAKSAQDFGHTGILICIEIPHIATLMT